MRSSSPGSRLSLGSSAGVKHVHDRIHLLRIADKFGWEGANDFVGDELARDKKEEKKLKGIRKEFETKRKAFRFYD